MTSKLLTTIFCLTISYSAISQDKFDQELKRVFSELQQKIEASGLSRIGVLGFYTENNEVTKLGKYISQDFEVYINNSTQYQVYGRGAEVIDKIIEENNLGSKRKLSDESTVKLGNIKGLEGMIIGSYSVIGENVRVRAKLLNVSTAQQIGAVIATLPLDNGLKSLMGLSFGKNGSGMERGEVKVTHSDESYDYAYRQSENCSVYHSGDVCFVNNMNFPIIVRFVEDFSPLGIGGYTKQIQLPNGEKKKIIYRNQEIIIQPNKRSCYYELGYGMGSYRVFKKREGSNIVANSSMIRSGQLYVEECNTKVMTIR